MIKATKIKMQSGKEKSNSITEIESIYLTGVKVETYYKKENLYDFIVNNPTQLIQVNIEPYPTLIAAVKNGQKYVRSAPNETTNDNLLNLPRE